MTPEEAQVWALAYAAALGRGIGDDFGDAPEVQSERPAAHAAEAVRRFRAARADVRRSELTGLVAYSSAVAALMRRLGADDVVLEADDLGEWVELRSIERDAHGDLVRMRVVRSPRSTDHG